MPRYREQITSADVSSVGYPVKGNGPAASLLSIRTTVTRGPKPAMDRYVTTPLYAKDIAFMLGVLSKNPAMAEALRMAADAASGGPYGVVSNRHPYEYTHQPLTEAIERGVTENG